MEGFRRIFTSTIFFGTDQHRTQASVWDCQRVGFFDRMKLWTPRSGSTAVCEGQQNLVVLSESFWTEVSEHPIPVDREIVRALAHSPGALDFYMWLAWRSYGCTKEQLIPLFGASGLALQLGGDQYARTRDFRRSIQRLLDTLRCFWPDCPAEIQTAKNALVVRPSSDSHRRL
jgi:hypothetical protein